MSMPADLARCGQTIEYMDLLIEKTKNFESKLRAKKKTIYTDIMELLPGGLGSTLKFILKIENRIQELIGHIKAVRECVIGTHLQLKRRFCASATSKADTSRLNRRVKERERKKRRRKENTAHSHIINTVCTISKVGAVEIETALDDNKKKPCRQEKTSQTGIKQFFQPSSSSTVLTSDMDDSDSDTE